MKLWTLTPFAAIVATAAVPSVAHAHFIWATMENRQARFALLEGPSQKPDARFGSYVEGLKGDLALGAVTDGFRTCALPAGKSFVFAEKTVGVKNREGIDYLLVYHARGNATLFAASEPSKAPFEVLIRQEGSELIARVCQDGWPVPEAEVTLHLPGTETETTKTADLKGEARFALPTPFVSGTVGVRAKIVEGKTGELEGKKYAQVHHWATATAPLAPPETFTRSLRKSFEGFHESVSGAAFNATLFSGKLTRAQIETHLQQRALVHNELHRILNGAAGLPYGPAHKEMLNYLFSDLLAMGSGWPTEAQARPRTAAFLTELRASEARGPYFALGVLHVYYGGTTNGGANDRRADRKIDGNRVALLQPDKRLPRVPD